MKERFLTVLVPIKDSDATVVSTLPTASASNVNVIYKHNGVYKRSTFNASTGQYQYVVVKDREFPYLGEPMEIFDFSYDATRMGNAPTISAQNVMWYAKKDASGNDITLDELFLERFGECHVSFNGENLYLKQVPTCGKDNEDARYKYDMDFVSERVVLETAYIYDVVQPFATEKPVSESATFSFYGDINELKNRINASLLKSGLASLELRSGVSSFLSYEEFNSLGLGTFPYPESWTQSMKIQFYTITYANNNGDYNQYLRNNVYKVDSDGEFIQSGYVCKIGKDKKGEMTTSEEKLIQFDQNYIHDALQKVHDDFELQYYIYSEKDSNGNFTGNTIIMIADCEHDFAEDEYTLLTEQPSDWQTKYYNYYKKVSGQYVALTSPETFATNTYYSKDYTRDADGIPTTTNPFDYGVSNALISKEKTNTTDKIITRITGVGSEDNIPWYYPNPNADGWIKPICTGVRYGTDVEMDVDYPKDEGTTTAENVRYEKYIKNRIGKPLQYGKEVVALNPKFDYSLYEYDTLGGLRYYFNYLFNVSTSNCKLFYNLKCSCGVIASYHIFFTKDGSTYSASLPQSPNPPLPTIMELPTGSYVVNVRIELSQTVLKRTAEYYYHSQTVQQSGGSVLVQCFSPYKDLYLYLASPFQADWYWCTDIQHPSETKVSVILPSPNKTYYAWHDNDETSGAVDKYEYNSSLSLTKTQNCYMDVDEFIRTFMNGEINVLQSDGWYLDGKKVNLLTDYGMIVDNSEYDPEIYDVINFKCVKYLTPQKTLMPQVYIKTDGERRFYNAVNYPINGSTPDEAIGEEASGGQIINPLYYKEDTTTHYDFENEYIQQRPHEHIEKFDDIKPSIKGQVNTVSGQTFRIDVVEEFAYDALDDDDIWENNDNGNISGEYKHPYFFAKLRPLGFNIFDLALQEDMVISMTTGHCGACNFKIGVDENTKKNPVQIWEYDVYEGADFATKTFRYSAGTLRRYMDTSNLYYDKDGTAAGYVQVDSYSSARVGFIVSGETNSTSNGLYERSVYSAEAVKNGMVGALKQEGRTHFDGDVKTSGRFISSQQDTSEGYVWVALMKDTDTYGVIMPSAKQNYVDPNFNVYIRPNSIADIHTSTSTPEEDEENADKFVIINIRMPQVYLRRAEEELSKKIIEYMYDNNYQKFNFSINFSRIYMSDNEDVDGYLNENSVLYVNFNNKIYRQYVKHYVYRMSKDAPLPEINVDMNEELSVSRTQTQRTASMQQRMANATARSLRSAISYSEGRMTRRTLGRNEDALVSGNLVSRNAVTSFGELQNARKKSESDIFDTQTDLSINHFRKGDFVLSEKTLTIGDDITVPSEVIFKRAINRINTFNGDVKTRINQIRRTVEYRLPVASGGTLKDGCLNYKYDVDPKMSTSALLWLNDDGTLYKVNYNICTENTNMTDIKWVDIDANE